MEEAQFRGRGQESSLNSLREARLPCRGDITRRLDINCHTDINISRIHSEHEYPLRLHSTSHLPWAMDFDNRTHGRMASVDSDHNMSMHHRRPSVPVGLGHRPSRRKDSVQHPKPPLTPNSSTIPHNMSNPLLPSAPASPPTPAPSPTPHQRAPTLWNLTFDDTEDPVLDEARHRFVGLDIRQKENWLRSLVDVCDSHSLSFLHQIVSPRLKKDPFKALPNELCFKVGRATFFISSGTSLLMISRYSNSSTIPKHLSALRKFQGGGVKS